MRKILLISAVVIGVVVLVAAGLLTYAALNLNSIIKANQAYLLAKATDSLGRQVRAREISVSLGWGIGLNVKSVKIADDPRFSQLPFVQADEVSCEVALMPLLARKLEITRLILKQPIVRVIRNSAGELNVSSLGKKDHARAQVPPPTPPAQTGAPSGQGLMLEEPVKTRSESAALQRLVVTNLAIEGGQLLYQDAASGGAPINISDIDLEIEGFNPSAPFKVGLRLTVLSDVQNFKASGQLGPLMRDGVIDPKRIPFAVKMTAGPVTLDRLRGLPQLRGKIPARLSMPDPVSLQARVDGRADAVSFEVSTDLSASRIVYLGAFNKPAGMALKLKAAGQRRGAAVAISQADLTLADLKAEASKIALGTGTVSAHLDTNRFGLDALTKTIAAMAKYDASGKAEVHADVRVVEDKPPDINGTVVLAGVSIKPEGAKIPGVTDINSNIRLAGNSATIEPTTFATGGAHGSFEAHAESLQPLRATFSVKAGDVKLSRFVPSRPANEELRQVSASGSASQSAGAMDISAQLNSDAGLVAGVPYQNLALSADYGGERVKVRSLNLNAFGGTIAAVADATLGVQPAFTATLDTNNVDLRQALTAQKAKLADTLRGQLTGEVKVSGRGRKFDEVKPTLQGSGRMAIENGKLIGINLGAETLNRVKGIPGIETLLSPTLIARHPELFKDRDTELNQASLSFVLQGLRIITHDLTVASSDYRLLGDGWLDMDKNIDLTAHILMSKQFSSDLRAERKNVVYLENQQGEIDVPVIIRGTLPKPAIQPDIRALIERAATKAIEKKGQSLLGKFLGNLGGAQPPPAGGGTAPPPAAPPNPLEQLKKLF